MLPLQAWAGAYRGGRPPTSLVQTAFALRLLKCDYWLKLSSRLLFSVSSDIAVAFL